MIPMAASSKEKPFIPPPLKEVVRKGTKIKVYLNERLNASTTAYTAAVATGEFTKEGRPIVEPINPNLYDRYDFYLSDIKVHFLRMPSAKNVIERHVNRVGNIALEVKAGKAPKKPKPKPKRKK